MARERAPIANRGASGAQAEKFHFKDVGMASLTFYIPWELLMIILRGRGFLVKPTCLFLQSGVVVCAPQVPNSILHRGTLRATQKRNKWNWKVL